MNKLAEQLRDSARALREVYANRGLRRLQLAWAGSIIGTWAFTVALAVYAYHHGGAAAIGLVVLIRWLPAAFASPFMGVLGDRYPKVPVMIVSDLLRAVAFAGITVCVRFDAPAAAVYVLVAATSVIMTAFRPAQAALLPALSRTPDELTAANVSSSTLESLGFCVGPALGGVLLAVSNTWIVFALTTATFLWSALQLFGLLGTAEPEPSGEHRAIVHDLVEGFRTIAHDSRLQVVIGIFSAQTLVNGALNVLLAVSAFQLLGLGSGGVGYLTAAVGVGGLIGAIFSLMLVGRKRLAGVFGLAVAGTGGPLLFIAPHPTTGIALVACGLIGLSNIIEDVTGFTLLQRTAPSEVLSRVFGVLHSLFYATIAAGAILAPRLIDLIGVRWSLVAVGAVLPILSILTRTQLVRIDDGAVDRTSEIALLQEIPIFAPLSSPVLEGLAGRLIPVHAAAGQAIVREGESGDRFYMISSGEVAVSIGGDEKAAQGPGDHFGEIALLRDMPRTATVTARTDTHLLALERDDFLAAVTGHAGSTEAAEAVVGARLGISPV